MTLLKLLTTMSQNLTDEQWQTFVQYMNDPAAADPKWAEVARKMLEYRTRKGQTMSDYKDERGKSARVKLPDGTVIDNPDPKVIDTTMDVTVTWPTDNRNMPCYLGVDDEGLVVSVCVDNPEHRKDVAKFCSDTVKDGLRLARCSVGDLWDGTVKLYEPLPDHIR